MRIPDIHMPRMRVPAVYSVGSMPYARTEPVPAPFGERLKARLRAAWRVFTGRYDAVRWDL